MVKTSAVVRDFREVEESTNGVTRGFSKVRKIFSVILERWILDTNNQNLWNCIVQKVSIIECNFF